MSQQFNPGDEVFDIHGRAGSYVGRVSGGHVVEPMFEREEADGEPYYGDAQTWKEVFAKPPTEKLNAEVARIEAELAAARQALAQVREARRAEDSDHQARAAARKQVAQLQQLDDYIAGKITHFVADRYSYDTIEIHEAAEFLKVKDGENSRFDPKLRLLSLYGGSKGDLSWHISDYSEGGRSDAYSGQVFPCTSLEQAQEKAAAQLLVKCAEWRKQVHNQHIATSLARCAAKLGLTLPDDVAAVARAVEANRRITALAAARDAATKAAAELAALESAA